MKRFVYTLALMLFACVVSFGQNVETTAQRAKNLSDKMIRELQLNNYQSRKLREINMEKARKMAEFEAKYAGNEEEINKCFMGVCKERDQELANLLSTSQYSQYYSARKTFNAYDLEYAMKLKKENSKVAKRIVPQSDEDSKRTFPKPQTAVVKESGSNK